jgi:hypothetical protein
VIHIYDLKFYSKLLESQAFEFYKYVKMKPGQITTSRITTGANHSSKNNVYVPFVEQSNAVVFGGVGTQTNPISFGGTNPSNFKFFAENTNSKSFDPTKKDVPFSFKGPSSFTFATEAQKSDPFSQYEKATSNQTNSTNNCKPFSLKGAQSGMIVFGGGTQSNPILFGDVNSSKLKFSSNHPAKTASDLSSRPFEFKGSQPKEITFLDGETSPSFTFGACKNDSKKSLTAGEASKRVKHTNRHKMKQQYVNGSGSLTLSKLSNGDVKDFKSAVKFGIPSSNQPQFKVNKEAGTSYNLTSTAIDISQVNAQYSTSTDQIFMKNPSKDDNKVIYSSSSRKLSPPEKDFVITMSSITDKIKSSESGSAAAHHTDVNNDSTTLKIEKIDGNVRIKMLQKMVESLNQELERKDEDLKRKIHLLDEVSHQHENCLKEMESFKTKFDEMKRTLSLYRGDVKELSRHDDWRQLKLISEELRCATEAVDKRKVRFTPI